MSATATQPRVRRNDTSNLDANVNVHRGRLGRAPGDWFCHVRVSLGSGGGWEELGVGKAGHALAADLGHVGEEVQYVHPAGHPDHQLGGMVRWWAT